MLGKPGVSVSRLALEHGVNGTLIRKWIKTQTVPRSLPPSSSPAFIPVQLERSADRTMSRQSSVVTVDLPVTCDEVRGPEFKRTAAFCSPAKVSASLPNSVKLSHVQTGR